jgi:asparagine synthase (glutamine-hydrolysing)
MFGILNRKQNDVLQHAHSVLASFKEKAEDGWILTSEKDTIPISGYQNLAGKSCLIYCKNPFINKYTLGLDGKMYESISPNTTIKATIRDYLKEMLERSDGEYSVALTNGNEIAVARDALGRKPIFYAYNDEICAFSSNKEYLWHIGLKNVKPLRSGQLALLSKSHVDISNTTEIKKPEQFQKDFKKVITEYHRLIHESVVKRLKDYRKVGVLLSGGVDSTLLAKLVMDFSKRLGIEMIAYTAGTKDSADIEYASRFAKATGLNHKTRMLGLKEIEKVLPKVIKVVEERDFVQIEAGIGVFSAEEIAAQDGVEVIFSGQGPDEMWGGYSWYPKVVEKEGYEEFFNKSWSDLQRADIETLDRENKIANFLGLDIVFPYLDTELVELAMSVAPELKIISPDDQLGKRPHRAVAKQAGVPPEYADRGKDAAQHGTGIHDLLDELTRSKGFTRKSINRIGYESNKITAEKLGSSSRYGYKYGDKKMWMIDDHIQFFFDVIAYGLRLLNDDERKKIEKFITSFRYNDTICNKG